MHVASHLSPAEVSCKPVERFLAIRLCRSPKVTQLWCVDTCKSYVDGVVLQTFCILWDFAQKAPECKAAKRRVEEAEVIRVTDAGDATEKGAGKAAL